MNTEITIITNITDIRGWVLYDAECAFCAGWAGRLQGLLLRRRFFLAPLQAPWVRERMGWGSESPLTEMVLLSADGTRFGGADALAEIARAFWWSWPLHLLAKLPGMMKLLRGWYGHVAARRHCLQGGCAVRTDFFSVASGVSPDAEGRHPAARPPGFQFSSAIDELRECRRARRLGSTSGGTPDATLDRSIHPRGVWLDWTPLTILLALAVASQTWFAPWGYMWALSFALFFGCKWLTWRRARREGASPTPARSVGYVLAWVGMDARRFLSDSPFENPSEGRSRRGNEADSAADCSCNSASSRRRLLLTAEAWFALGRTLFGAILIWGIVRRFVDSAPILAGWIGLFGIVFILHFGLFHLLALVWRCAGINAQPIMRAPVRAPSLGEFWGRRWNLAFHRLVHEFAFRPLNRRLGRGAALLGVFLASGLIHELVISLPAGAGFGLPTAYFLTQGMGILVERSEAGQRWGLGRGWLGWAFTILITAGPAFWLFHPPFLTRVILPFLKAIHAY